MTKLEIREPRQKRSIEKKRKIAQAGFKLFSEKGFHHTNTNEIAREAGVSIGIVYHYFKDKKAILLSAMDQIVPKFDISAIHQLNLSNNKEGIRTFLCDIIDKNINFHESTKGAHEEFQALRHSDSEVCEYMNQFENQFLSEIADALPSLGFSVSNSYEKIDMVYHMIDHYCDAVVFNKRNCINYATMKTVLVDAILNIIAL